MSQSFSMIVGWIFLSIPPTSLSSLVSLMLMIHTSYSWWHKTITSCNECIHFYCMFVATYFLPRSLVWTFAFVVAGKSIGCLNEISIFALVVQLSCIFPIETLVVTCHSFFWCIKLMTLGIQVLGAIMLHGLSTKANTPRVLEPGMHQKRMATHNLS